MDQSTKLCFIIGPIGAAGSDTRNHADLLLEFIIKPVMRDFSQYRVKRQDEDSKPGMIDSQIIIALRDADLVIADLSHLNANAFYEIGIRHMVAKPIIHMQIEDQRIPFDLSLYKTVPFAFINPATYVEARDKLRAQVSEVIADGYKVDNPVTRALGQEHFEQNASPEMKVLADELNSVSSRLHALEVRAERGFVSFNSPTNALAAAAAGAYAEPSTSELRNELQAVFQRLERKARLLKNIEDDGESSP